MNRADSGTGGPKLVVCVDCGSDCPENGPIYECPKCDTPKPEAPDASGLYHDRPIKEIGNARPAKSVKVPKQIEGRLR